MIRKVRGMLDDGFLVGLVFALFLAGKIVPFLVLVGVVPIILFWAKSDYKQPPATLARFLVPSIAYFAFCIILFYAYPGLPPGEKPPGNPDIELYAVAIALLAVGFLRGRQIKKISARFHLIVPPSLLAAFAVLSAYMFLGIDGCRVKVAAAWPFIPAVIFTTLTFLLLLGWENRSKQQRYLRLVIVALSVVVVLAYTGSRGVAIGQFTVIVAMMLLRVRRDFRQGLPTTKEFVGAIAAGLLLCVAVGVMTGCNSFVRWSALSEVAADIRQPANKPPVLPATQPPAPALAGKPVVAGQPAASAKPALTGKSAATGKPAATVKPAVKKPVKAASNVPRAPIKTSISIRLGMWEASLQAIREAPILGHGALSLRPIIQDRFGFEHNHNQYLAWLVTGGAVFLVLGLSFIGIPILISKDLLPSDRAIVVLSVTGLWGVSMIFDAFLNLDFYLHYFSLLLGFLFSLVADSAKPSTEVPPECIVSSTVANP